MKQLKKLKIKELELNIEKLLIEMKKKVIEIEDLNNLKQRKDIQEKQLKDEL